MYFSAAFVLLVDELIDRSWARGMTTYFQIDRQIVSCTLLKYMDFEINE